MHVKLFDTHFAMFGAKCYDFLSEKNFISTFAVLIAVLDITDSGPSQPIFGTKQTIFSNMLKIALEIVVAHIYPSVADNVKC